MSMRIAAAMLALLSVGAARAQDAPAAGDAALGEKVFVKCKACHQIGEGAHTAVGPQLNGLIGRHSASIPDYSYSEAMKNSNIVWDEATFKEYIKDPKAKVPGTKMAFAGLSKQSDIDNVTAYLKTFGPDGKKIP
ncbi:cytochrome c family protein [Lichenibacterium minor]|uniref:Cytochrome c family protein n=1 Tax=Lichenibacterium minor TaxID=2316528 RepID=A0A4Q2U313_9HYPH|nr:cytochrome c family protein [Lichenibacterium minor]RYC30570.1 cytochrome c family protein [Lichenibacterium minor]